MFFIIWEYTGVENPANTPLGNSFINCISLAVLLEEGFSEDALRKELVIAPFVGRFKAATLSKSC